MGGKKKKSNNGPIKKESKYKIPARFDCPLCDAKHAIAVKIFRATGEATVYCRVCKVGVGRHWKILPLEKAVDVFFRFREELMKLDRQYLEAHDIVAPSSGDADALSSYVDSSQRHAGHPRRADQAERGANVASVEEEDEASSYFQPAAVQHDDDEDEYAAMFS